MARLIDMGFPFLRNWDKVLLAGREIQRRERGFCGDELACRLVHLVAGLVTLSDSQIRRATFWIRYYRAEKEVAYSLAGEGLVALKLFPRRYSYLGRRGM
jgi:hypothetical protein